MQSALTGAACGACQGSPTLYAIFREKEVFSSADKLFSAVGQENVRAHSCGDLIFVAHGAVRETPGGEQIAVFRAEGHFGEAERRRAPEDLRVARPAQPLPSNAERRAVPLPASKKAHTLPGMGAET